MNEFAKNGTCRVSSIKVNVDLSQYTKSFIDNVIAPILSDDKTTLVDVV